MKPTTIVATCKSHSFRQARRLCDVTYREWRYAREAGIYPPPESRGRPEASAVEQAILELVRSKPQLSINAVALAAGCAVATAHKYLDRHGLTKLWQRLQYAGVHLQELDPDLSKARKTPLKVDGPGALVHIDAKRYAALQGGLLVVGITCVDNYSGFAWCVLCPDGKKTGANSVAAFTEFRQRFPCTVRRLYSDNGSEFVNSKLNAACKAEGIEFKHTKVGHPWSNGKVERCQSLLKREVMLPLLAHQQFESIAQLQTELDGKLGWFNHERPHFGATNKGISPYVVAEACCGLNEEQRELALAELRASIRAKNREQWEREQRNESK